MNGERITLNVWVVDDEPGMCVGASGAARSSRPLRRSAAGGGFRGDDDGLGEILLEKLKSSRPHILLLDSKLPGIEGVEILQELRKQKLQILTIMITAYATLERAVEATKLGAYDFLAKPFTPEELRYALQKASRDILLTERAQRLEHERRQVRFEFISVLAHELKSPLNAIEGYMDMFRNKLGGPLPEDYLPAVDRVGARIEGMRKLITDLIDLTSLESGRRRRAVEPRDLAAVAAECVETHRPAAARAGVEVAVQPASPCVYPCDRTEVEMLLGNLVSNAIKYNRPGGSVAVSCRQADGRVCLTVSDTGIGISPEDQARLFREFSRIRNEKTRAIEGSGLGLSIVQRIAALYGGAAIVESAPEKGSTFTVTLPCEGPTER